MKRTTALIVAAATASGLTLVGPASPASAAVSTSVVGTIVTVNATGETEVSFSCVGGNFRVNGGTTSPPVACSALSSVKINGDASQQIIRANDLRPATFPSIASNSIKTGDGNDTIFTSLYWDTVDAGGGADAVVVDIAGASESQIVLGGQDNDTLLLRGTAGDDEFVGSSTGAAGSIVTRVGSANSVGRDYSGVDALHIEGEPGDDLIDMDSIFGSSIQVIDMYGGDGDDTFKSSTQLTYMDGGAGTNTFDGGQAADWITTRSETDVIKPGTGLNRIIDTTSLRSGGRAVSDEGGSDQYTTELYYGDAVWRVRPGAAGSTKATASLTRPGIALNPASVDKVIVAFGGSGEAVDRNLADVVASPDTEVVVNDGTKKLAMVDLTIPSGSWTTSGTIGNGSGIVDPTTPGLGTITLNLVGKVSVHGPWTNKNRGWAHRATRDLLFRFATTGQLDTLQGQLTGGTSRATLAGGMLDTDEYRGLDVDRVFVKYLRRAADPGGRAYWINSIDNGKALWRFRAQLFGSNEYFSKAGGTNAAYVTKAYNDVLGRNPDAGGKTYWTNKLNNGADRGSVALQFINSPESRRRLVDDQYLRFLDRKPTADEQAAWVAKIPENRGEQELIAALVTSTEYYDRT